MTAQPPHRAYFAFDEQKATEAAARLFRRRGLAAQMTKIRLSVGLYLAERQALQDHGRPLCGGRYDSTHFGPVLGHVNDRIESNSCEVGAGVWVRHFRLRNDRGIDMLNDAPPFKLSHAEIEILDAVHERTNALDDSEFVDLGHELPEWQGPGLHSIPILPESLLRLLGKGPGEIEAIMAERAAQENLAEILKW